MKKKTCRVLTLLLSFSIVLCMVIGMASAQDSEEKSAKFIIGGHNSATTLADETYTTCPGVALNITISSSISQDYIFSRSDGGDISAALVGRTTKMTGSGTTYYREYNVTIKDEGTFTVTAKGTSLGSLTFTMVVEHTPVDDPAVEPTCTQTGLTEGSHCSSCGKVFEAQETIPALGHTPVIDDAVAPTCTEPGLTEGSHCSVCGAVIVEQEVIPAGHTWNEGEIITEPTCSEEGEMFYVCTVCGETKTEPIDTLPHTWSEPTWDWSDDYSEATVSWTCDVCGTEETKNAEITSETTATCTEAGETTYTATVTLDEVEYTEEKTTETDALGHDWETEWIWSEDHTSATATRTCSVCGETETVEATVESTETEDGEITYTATATFDDGTSITDSVNESDSTGTGTAGNAGTGTGTTGTGSTDSGTTGTDDTGTTETDGTGTGTTGTGSTGTYGTGSTGTGSSGNSGYSGTSGNNGSTATSPQTDDPTSFSAWWIIVLGISFCLAGCGALVLYRFRKVSAKN